MRYYYLLLAVCFSMSCEQKKPPISHANTLPLIVCNKATGSYAIQVGNLYLGDTIPEVGGGHMISMAFTSTKEVYYNNFRLEETPYEKVFHNYNDALLYAEKWLSRIKQDSLNRIEITRLRAIQSKEDSIENLKHIYQTCKP
jgi:hypothetical protein